MLRSLSLPKRLFKHSRNFCDVTIAQRNFSIANFCDVKNLPWKNFLHT